MFPSEDVLCMLHLCVGLYVCVCIDLHSYKLKLYLLLLPLAMCRHNMSTTPLSLSIFTSQVNARMKTSVFALQTVSTEKMSYYRVHIQDFDTSVIKSNVILQNTHSGL